MLAPGSPDPPAPQGRLDRLFDSAKFRRRARVFYRLAGPLVLLLFAWYALAALGLVPKPLEGNRPEWLYGLSVMLVMLLAVSMPVLFVVATVGGLAMARDWRFAAPLWLFSAATGLFLVTVFLVSDLPREEEAAVWRIAAALFAASAAWATVVGYRSRN